MATPTMNLRHVWRTLHDGNGEHRVLVMQQWYIAEGWEHSDIIHRGGFWQDVDVVTMETDTLEEMKQL